MLAVRDRSCFWSHDISVRTQKIPSVRVAGSRFLRVRRSKRRRHIWLRRRTHEEQTQQSMNMFFGRGGDSGVSLRSSFPDARPNII